MQTVSSTNFVLTCPIVLQEVVVVVKVSVGGHRPRRRRVARLGVLGLVGGDEVSHPLVVLPVGGEPEGAAARDPAVRVAAGLAKQGDPLADGLSVGVVPVGRNGVDLGQELQGWDLFDNPILPWQNATKWSNAKWVSPS